MKLTLSFHSLKSNFAEARLCKTKKFTRNEILCTRKLSIRQRNDFQIVRKLLISMGGLESTTDRHSSHGFTKTDISLFYHGNFPAILQSLLGVHLVSFSKHYEDGSCESVTEKMDLPCFKSYFIWPRSICQI